MKDKKQVDLVGPVLLVSIGIIMLLNNLNMLDWSLWDVIRLWPVLLVAAGLELMVGRRSLVGSIVSALVVLGLILGIVWFGGVNDVTGQLGDYESVSYPVDTAKFAEVRVDTGVADIRVEGMSDSQNLIEGDIYPGRRASLVTDYDGGSTAEVTLIAKSPNGAWGPNAGGRWNLELNESVQYDLDFDYGIGETDLDLTDMSVDEVRVDYGIGRVSVQLPASGNIDLTVDGGIGEVVIEVPDGLEVKVYTESGLVNRNMPTFWDRDGNTWTSDDFAGADNKAWVQVNLGIGTVTVREN